MALSHINSPSMTLSWINSLCVTLSEKCHESLQAMISSMVATLFTDKARALNLSSYIDVCTTVCTLWKTYNVYLNLNLRQLYFLHNNVCTLHIRTLLGKTLAWLSKNYFHSEPSLTTTTLREFASTIGFHHHTRTETAPWQYILKIMLIAQICRKKAYLHTTEAYLHIARAQWACLVPYSGHSEARQATRMIVQIHFSYTLCQTKPIV